MTIDDALGDSKDDHLLRVHVLYRDILDAVTCGVSQLRNLGEEHAAGALESWGRGVEVHAERHIQRMKRKDHRP